MSLPIPPVALKDHCSVVYDHTLYTFQPNAFQSLDLRPGGRWSQLPLGVSTTGSVCVQGSPNNEYSMFVVGGVANSSFPDYTGLQRYIFKSRRWETISPVSKVTQNRRGHSSVYLNASASILVFAGSQDGKSTPTSATFLISASPPYNVISHGAPSILPPPTKPLLIPWNASHALVLGGTPDNKNLSTFGPGGWHTLDTRLTAGLKDSSKVQATLFEGGDGSKTLEIFDMSASPNNITRVELQRATEKSSSGAKTKTSTSSSLRATRTQNPSRKRKREIPERPAYNSTSAPQVPRNGFSLARDPDGLIVISGGEPEESKEVLSLFNQTGNTWIEESQFFAKAVPDEPSSTSSAIPSPTQTSGPKGPPVTSPSPNTNSKNRPLTILGATLGGVFGFIALVILVLLLLRCFRRRHKRTHKRINSDYPSEGKQEIGFGDRDVNYRQEAGGTVAGHAGHKHMDSDHSATSLAIMSGRTNAVSSQSKPGFLHKPGGSNGSSKSFFGRGRSPLAPSPPLVSGPFPVEDTPNDVPVQTTPEPRTEPRTDTGWSRYFANNSSTNLSNIPPGSPHHEPGSRPTTYNSGSQSDYVSSSNPHESAEVPPLSVRTNVPYPPNTRLVSPTSGLPLALQPGIAASPGASVHEPSTPSTLASRVLKEDEYQQDEDHSHGSEGMESWTPIAASERGSTWEERPISSIYTDSVIYPHPGERVRIPNFPRVPSTTRNSTRRNSQVDSSGDSRGMRSMASRDLRSSPFSDHERELPEVGVRRVEPQAFGEEQGARLGARRDHDAEHAARGGMRADDMSWLNLGR